MSWEWDNRYTDWLPPDQAQYITEHEDERFRRLVEAVQGLRARVPTEEYVTANAAVLLELQPWISHINRCVPRPAVREPRSLCDVTFDCEACRQH